MKYISLVFSLMAVSIFFSQDLQLDKVDTKNEKAKNSKNIIKYPLELSIGAGTLISSNYKGIYTNGLQPYGYLYLPNVSTDTSQKFILSPSYSLGIRKRLGNFRYGINLDYSTFSRAYENSQMDSIDFIANQSNYEVNFSSLNFNSEYLLVDRNKYNVSFGLNMGVLKFLYKSNFNCSRYLSYVESDIDWNTGQIVYTNVTDTILQNVDVKLQNLRFIVGPTVSFEYKISKSVKTQLFLYYNYTSNNSMNGINNSKYVINGQTEVYNSSFQSGDSRTNFGGNLKIVFTLGK